MVVGLRHMGTAQAFRHRSHGLHCCRIGLRRGLRSLLLLQLLQLRLLVLLLDPSLVSRRLLLLAGLHCRAIGLRRGLMLPILWNKAVAAVLLLG